MGGGYGLLLLEADLKELHQRSPDKYCKPGMAKQALQAFSIIRDVGDRRTG